MARSKPSDCSFGGCRPWYVSCASRTVKMESRSAVIFYRLHSKAVRIVPGKPSRDWMDATTDLFAYRCLPLTIANACGWELLLPCEVTAEWNGGRDLKDITVTHSDEAWSEGRLASSHFGHGILTFQTGYLVRTPPGTSTLARGVPNWPRPGISPLEGLIETDWLPFSFTMNWMFTAPGKVTFKAGEPFCFLMPVQIAAVEATEARILPLDAAPEEAARLKEWASLRGDFNARLSAREPNAMKERWQKWYTRGIHPDGTPAAAVHRTKLRISEPEEDRDQ